jgi:hypothetical protein
MWTYELSIWLPPADSLLGLSWNPERGALAWREDGDAYYLEGVLSGFGKGTARAPPSNDSNVVYAPAFACPQRETMATCALRTSNTGWPRCDLACQSNSRRGGANLCAPDPLSDSYAHARLVQVFASRSGGAGRRGYLLQQIETASSFVTSPTGVPPVATQLMPRGPIAERFMMLPSVAGLTQDRIVWLTGGFTLSHVAPGPHCVPQPPSTVVPVHALQSRESVTFV